MFRGGGSRLISNNKPFGLVQPSKTSQSLYERRCLNNEHNLYSLSQAEKTKQKKSAFTLAEAMIAVVVIGVISAIVVPILYNNVMGNVKEKRISTFYNKLSKATDNMLVSSGMQGYSDTMDFVNYLKKYMKIDKVCDNQHIAECWGTTKVVVDDNGKEWDISETTTPRKLIISSDKVGDSGYKDVVAIVTADQVPMIISYNKACELNQNDRNWGTNGKSSSLNCISGVFDWNGGRNPNKLGNDVITLGESAGLGSKCAFEINGKCYLAPQTVIPLYGNECKNRKAELGVQYCMSEYDAKVGKNYASLNGDYYAGAAAMCGGKQNMATKADLEKIANELYPSLSPFPAESGKYCNGECIDKEAATKYGINPDPAIVGTPFIYNSSYAAVGRSNILVLSSDNEPNNIYNVYVRSFFVNGSEYETTHRDYAGGSSHSVICKVDE